LAFGNEKLMDKIEKSRSKRWRFFKWFFKKYYLILYFF